MSSLSDRVGSVSRDQLVSALVVGAVVVLLGFASGLGINPAASVQPASSPPTLTTGGQQPSTGTVPVAAAGGGLAQTPVGTGGVNYEIPPDDSAGSGYGAAEPTTAPSSTAPTAPASSTAPTTTAPSTTAPAPTCGTTLLTGLVDTLLGGASGSGVLGVLGGAGGTTSDPLGLGGLLGGLTGSGSSSGSTSPAGGLLAVLVPGTTASAAPTTGDDQAVSDAARTLAAADPQDLLGSVTSLLPVLGTATGASGSGTAAACTADVTDALPLIAKGDSVTSAVAAVTR